MRGTGSASGPRDAFLIQTADRATALYRLTDRLYRARNMPEVYEAALDAITETLECERASVLLFDSESVMRFVAWRGLSEHYRSALEGHTPWKPGEPDPQPIFVSDIDATAESQKVKDTVKAEGIRALGFVPLVADGGAIGKFMTYYDRPRIFSEDERALAIAVARQIGFALERSRSERERERAEAHRDLLLAELNHRVKNTLAVVQGMAHQTFTSSKSVTEAKNDFDGRLRALGQAHDLLMRDNADRASLHELANNLLRGRETGASRCRVAGPPVHLVTRIATAVAMAMHELFTNAVKYGALSNERGTVDLGWQIEGRSVMITWQEKDGPAVAAPAHRGFGTILLERTLSDVGGSVVTEFKPEGIVCRMALPFDADQPGAVDSFTAQRHAGQGTAPGKN
jgi:two-component sensor histidine kinase